jgi:hypothetical protein
MIHRPHTLSRCLMLGLVLTASTASAQPSARMHAAAGLTATERGRGNHRHASARPQHGRGMTRRTAQGGAQTVVQAPNRDFLKPYIYAGVF